MAASGSDLDRVLVKVKKKISVPGDRVDEENITYKNITYFIFTKEIKNG